MKFWTRISCPGLYTWVIFLSVAHLHILLRSPTGVLQTSPGVGTGDSAEQEDMTPGLCGTYMLDGKRDAT